MPLPDYPSPPGNKPVSIHNITGPSSYTQVTTGSPPTGGQVITAGQLGLVDIEAVFSMGSDNGQYDVVPIIPSSQNNGVQSVILLWCVAATGAQVAGGTDVSGRTIRLVAIGH